MFSRSLVLKVAAFGPIEKLVRKSFLFRKLVRRFVAGDTLEEALVASDALLSQGYYVSLDLLGENVKSEEEALRAKNMYIDMLEAIASRPTTKLEAPKEACNISIKLTQCGFDQDDEFAEKNFREVLAAADRHGNFVRVDMEASEYTERTLAMIERVWPDFKNTGTVLQTYLYRTPDDLERMMKLGVRLRLVKGAYLEPATVAFPDKRKVDEAYVTLAKQMLLGAHYPAIATHDEKIINALIAFIEEQQIPRERFEFQMIYGVRRDLQERLRKLGYGMRIYVPFGESWYPYFSRRLAERPANMFFILKSLFKG